MVRSRWDEARLIGRHVNRKVLKLQKQFLEDKASSASARATLAQLRTLDTSGRRAWILVGNDLFLDFDLSALPESVEREQKMIQAVSGSMQLYARHQQGRTRPMALNTSQDDRKHRSFGWSCRMIKFDLEESQGIRRRIQGIEASSNFDGIMHYLRTLVDLMRDTEVPVDYYQLANDLYLLQYPDIQDRVFVKWSRDYYMVRDENNSNSPEPNTEKE